MRFKNDRQRKAVMAKLKYGVHSGGVVRAYAGEINKYDGKHKYFADGATKTDAKKNFRVKYILNNERHKSEIMDLAKKHKVFFADVNNYFYKPDVVSIGWTAKELFSRSKEQKDILIGNRPLMYIDKDIFGTLSDFGYDRKAKRYFVSLERWEYPFTVGTGRITSTKYYDKFSSENIFRLKKKGVNK